MNQNKARLLIANPYNDIHLELIKEFEASLDNHLPYQTSDILMDIRKKQSEEDYIKAKQNSRQIEENVYLIQDGKLKSSCYIEGNRDTKKCTFSYITPKQYQQEGYGKQMLEMAFEYVSIFLGIDTVELEIAKRNKPSIRLAKRAGFTKTGEFGMSDIYSKTILENEKGFYHL